MTGFNRFNQLWAQNGLLHDPTNAQADAGFAFMGPAPPTVELFNSLMAWNDDKDNWLFNQIANVIIDSGERPDARDLMQLLNALRRQRRLRLDGPMTLFIDSANGNDLNTGRQGSPFRTINRGFYYAQNDLDMARNIVTLQLAPGLYDPVSAAYPIYGIVVIRGDPASPRDCVIRNTAGSAIEASFGARLIVQGVALEARGADSDYTTVGAGLATSFNGLIHYNDVAFGPCSHAHMSSWQSGNIHTSTDHAVYTIYGGAQTHMIANYGGSTTNVGAHVSIENNPEFDSGFAHAWWSGLVQSWRSTYAGPARGPRFSVGHNGMIIINSTDPNFFPGDQPGHTNPNGIIG